MDIKDDKFQHPKIYLKYIEIMNDWYYVNDSISYQHFIRIFVKAAIDFKETKISSQKSHVRSIVILCPGNSAMLSG